MKNTIVFIGTDIGIQLLELVHIALCETIDRNQNKIMQCTSMLAIQVAQSAWSHVYHGSDVCQLSQMEVRNE